MAEWDGFSRIVWLNPDGEFVSMFKAERDAPSFLDYGYYLIPTAFLGRSI